MMRYYCLIILVFMIQITHASQEKLEEEWVNIDAEIFVPLQKNQQKQVEQKTKISLAEIVLDHGAVKNNDFITQYLSNTDLYFLLQVSKTISNSVRKFMKKREQEQKEKEQKLKEHFLYNFNAFIDYAHAASLDYLEIEIPENVLNDLAIGGSANYGPSIFIGRSDDHEYLNNNAPPTIFVTGLDNHWPPKIHRKHYRLKENETLKFTFHFRRYLKNKESHHVKFFGQTFEFKDLSFTLFRPWGKTFKFKCARQIAYLGYLDSNYKYKNQVNYFNFRSNPTVRVKMIEETGVKFKFKFHTSHSYTFRTPIYDFENIFPNFKNYFSFTKQQYESKNSIFLNNLNTYSANYLFGLMEDHKFEQQQQHPFYQNSNFGQQQQFHFDQNSNFGQQQQFHFDQNSNFGQQQQFHFDQNSNFGQQQQFHFQNKNSNFSK